MQLNYKILLLAGAFLAAGSQASAEAGEVKNKQQAKTAVVAQKTESLNYSPEQQKAMKKLKLQMNSALRPKFQQLHKMRIKLMNMAFSPNYQVSEVKALAQKQGGLLADIMVVQVETKHKMYALLTAEQKQKIKQLEKRIK